MCLSRWSHSWGARLATAPPGSGGDGRCWVPRLVGEDRRDEGRSEEDLARTGPPIVSDQWTGASEETWSTSREREKKNTSRWPGRVGKGGWACCPAHGNLSPDPWGQARIAQARQTTIWSTYMVGVAVLSASCPRNGSIRRGDTLISRKSGAATTGYRMGCRCISSNSMLVREGRGMLRAVTTF